MADRTDLLPPMLEVNPLWTQFAEVVESVWGTLGIPQSITQLKTLRQPMLVPDIAVSDALDEGKLININDVYLLEKDALIKTADLLGFRYYASGNLTDINYWLLCTYLAAYYNTAKGQVQWTDFLAFCIGSPFTVQNTWTRDYITFYPEGDPAIGTPVYEGGQWYPTTHIIVNLKLGRFNGWTMQMINDLIDYVANAELVVQIINIMDESEIKVNIGISSTTTISYV